MIKIIEKNYLVLVFLIVSLGIFFRIYNLAWGSPFFFHPDERNIASSISQLTPNNLNPHFFAYGTLPIYTVYFFNVFLNSIQSLFNPVFEIYKVTFENSILIGRLFSCLLSIGTLFLIYKICSTWFGKASGIISLCLASFSVGLIQYSHFSTFEMWLTFFTLFLLYSILNYLKTKKYIFYLACALSLGILISVKVSSLVFLPITLLILFAIDLVTLKKIKKGKLFFLEKVFLKIFVLLGVAASIVNTTSPFFWFDNNSFFSSINYESSVALGSLDVFYTQGFKNTVPVVYQAFFVYPFILNPFVFVVSIASILFAGYIAFKKRSLSISIILVFLLITFLSQSFLYVKWVRYYIPTLPFLYILLGFSLQSLKKRFVVTILIVISVIYSYSYYATVLAATDTRVDASRWASKHIAGNSKILTEVYDLGIVPFNSHFPHITLFNFYELDVLPEKEVELTNLIKESKYLILPSQRISSVRLIKPKLYQKGFNFYTSLENGKLGFKKIYETPCDLFCNILYLGDSLGAYEQTANVFDRPTVRIYENKK